MKSLSIKNVPDELVERLKTRAKRNHRSMQGEMLAIMEEAVPGGRLSLRDVYQMGRDQGLRTEGDSTATIRAERDAR